MCCRGLLARAQPGLLGPILAFDHPSPVLERVDTSVEPAVMSRIHKMLACTHAGRRLCRICRKPLQCTTRLRLTVVSASPCSINRAVSLFAEDVSGSFSRVRYPLRLITPARRWGCLRLSSASTPPWTFIAHVSYNDITAKPQGTSNTFWQLTPPARHLVDPESVQTVYLVLCLS